MTFLDYIELFWAIASAVITVSSIITKMSPTDEAKLKKNTEIALHIIKKLALNK